MAKKSKLKTPEWITEGYDSEEDYLKSKSVKKKSKKSEKIFNVKRCPSCKSDNVGVIIGRERKGEWECHKCKWKGKEINQEELTEEKFMKYLDEKGVEVS